MSDDDTTTDLARKPRPVTDELRAQVAELFGQGMGRNEIARELEVGAATVSKIAREHKPEPLLFDRAGTELALRARQIDLAVWREQLARKFIQSADDALDAQDSPVTLGTFGGKDNVWNETLLDAPTIEMRSTLVRTAMGASKAAVELLKIDASASVKGAVGVLGAMRDALGVAINVLEADGSLEGLLDDEAQADADLATRVRDLNTRPDDGESTE